METKGKQKRGNPNWAPGKSGNPAGRAKLPAELVAACRALAPECIAILSKIANDEDARQGDRIRAAEALLNRGYGTPAQSVEVTGLDSGPMAIRIIRASDAG